jgi:hypothetical protein
VSHNLLSTNRIPFSQPQVQTMRNIGSSRKAKGINWLRSRPAPIQAPETLWSSLKCPHRCLTHLKRRILIFSKASRRARLALAKTQPTPATLRTQRGNPKARVILGLNQTHLLQIIPAPSRSGYPTTTPPSKPP